MGFTHSKYSSEEWYRMKTLIFLKIFNNLDIYDGNSEMAIDGIRPKMKKRKNKTKNLRSPCARYFLFYFAFNTFNYLYKTFSPYFFPAPTPPRLFPTSFSKQVHALPLVCLKCA